MKLIDKDIYIDSLPTFRERTKLFNKDLNEVLRGPFGSQLLAVIEEQCLLEEKQFLGIDFAGQTALLDAVRLKERISARRDLIEHLIDLANEGTDVDTEQPSN